MNKTFYLTGLLVMLVDWLLIIATEKAYGDSPGRIRSVIAACVGGCHAILCMKPEYSFLCGSIWRLVMLGTAGCIAFPFYPKKIAAYIVMSLAIGSFVFGTESGNWLEIVISVILLFVILGIFLRNQTLQSGYSKIMIPTANGTVRITALHDTGNTLLDPVTGQSVLVVSANLAESLLGADCQLLRDPVKAVQKIKGTRLIPYHTVGHNGLMVAKKFENVIINQKKRSVLVAFSQNNIGNGRTFNALTGGCAA